MEVSDLEAGMLDEQIERETKMFLMIYDQIIDVERAPGHITWLPKGHPMTRKPGIFS